jgi:hypothetical protein
MTSGDHQIDVRNYVVHIAAFSLAAVVPAFFLVGSFLPLLPIAVSVTLAHSFLLALPLYLILRAYAPRSINLISSAAAGFALAAVSGTYFPWSWLHKSSRVQLILDGTLTYDGWFMLAQQAGVYGMLGALGGFMFWFVLLMCAALPGDAIECQSRD